MIDEETHRAAIAPMSYLTVLGSPSPGDAPAAAPACESAGWHRANVYRLAITPQTRVYEAGAGRGAASGPNDAAHRERSPSTFEGLELGDRVEVELIKQDTPERTARDSRHGRDRTFRGTAVSITILPEVPSDDNS
ncbi:MAG TPA: hypothetical protein VF590_08955, partial [Isosphaeraceae bacterium]|jgi:hypothetical protein